MTGMNTGLGIYKTLQHYQGLPEHAITANFGLLRSLSPAVTDDSMLWTIGESFHLYLEKR